MSGHYLSDKAEELVSPVVAYALEQFLVNNRLVITDQTTTLLTTNLETSTAYVIVVTTRGTLRMTLTRISDT